MQFDRLHVRQQPAKVCGFLGGRPAVLIKFDRFVHHGPSVPCSDCLLEILRPAACWFRFRRRQMLRGRVPVLCGLKVSGIDRHHLDRRCLVRLRRNDDCGGYAVVNREGQSLDQFLVGYDFIVSGWQDSVDPFQQERIAEDDGLALRTCGHRSYTAARRASGNSALSYKRRISLLSNRSSSTSR